MTNIIDFYLNLLSYSYSLAAMKLASSAQTLVGALQASFERFGASVAIDAPECKLTFAQLDEITRDIATELRTRISDQRLKSEPIVILMSRSVEFYVAQIAVLRAGGFFLPIDPAQPDERIQFLLADSQASLMLIRKDEAFAKPHSAASFLISVRSWKQDRQAKAGRGRFDTSTGFDVGQKCVDGAGETDFAYMIYTSGSSGLPKGVPIQHRAISNLCDWWVKESWVAAGDRTLQMLSVGFDASLEEIYPTLVAGGTLVPVQPEALNSMRQFLDFVERKKINKLHLPTAFFNMLATSLKTHDSLALPPSVRTVVLGGEQADASQVTSWFACVGSGVRLINAYGPTEATVATTYAVLEPGNQPTIGKPIDGVSLSIVGEDGQLVEPGQAGELFIAGSGVASHYWRRAELSAEKFTNAAWLNGQVCYRTGDLVRLGDNGNYEFLGRIDDQIKLRGYRVEPSEISNRLAKHSAVRQAHVLARRLATTGKNQHLVGYVIAKSADSFSEEELKTFLRERLPDYMIPTRIIAMESFPVTAGGKLDLDQFPRPVLDQLGGADDVEFRHLSETERKIGEVWKEILGVDRLDRETNFFQIGGDSLLAMRLVLQLENEFPGPVIPVSALIPSPTIASMAAYIDQRKNSSPIPANENWPLLTRLGTNGKPVNVVCLHAAGGGGMFYRELCKDLEHKMSIAVLESAILHQGGPVVLNRQNIAEMAKDYVDCLVEAGCEKRLTLVGFSFGALLAFEMSKLLLEKGFEVEKIINIDSANPQQTKRRHFLSRFCCRLILSATVSQRFADCKKILRIKRRKAIVEKQKKAGLAPPVELRSIALEQELGKLVVRYVPDRCEVPMHLIRGQDLDPQYSKLEDYGWSDHVSILSVTQIPGGHDSIFSKIHVNRLREVFTNLLD